VVLGPRLGCGHHPEPFRVEATATVIAEVKRLGLGRLVCRTGAMAGRDIPNRAPAARRFVRRYRRQCPAVDADRDAQEAVVRGRVSIGRWPSPSGSLEEGPRGRCGCPLRSASGPSLPSGGRISWSSW
jgi:hypothetical protein